MIRESSVRPHLPSLSLVLAMTLGACEAPAAQTAAPACDPDNGGLILPDGFCALVVADSVGRARHLEVAPNGDVFVALMNDRGPDRSVIPGGTIVLRDLDGDGRADVQFRWGENGGNEVILGEGFDLFYVPVPTSLAGETLATSHIRTRTGLNVLALRLPDDVVVPATALMVLEPDGELVMLGNESQREDFTKEFL